MDKHLLQEFDQLNELIDEPRHIKKLEDDTLVCECFCVNVADIRTTCSGSMEVDLEKLSSEFGLGTGCQKCIKESDYWVNRIF